MGFSPLRALQPLREAALRAVTAVLGDADGLVSLPVMGGPARGLHLKVRLRSEAGIITGKYERASVERLASLVRKGWVIWDCGAFIGYYAVMFSRLVGESGSVVAFEPDPVNYRRTRDNVERNGMENVRLVEMALGGPGGEVSFVSGLNQQSHLVGTYVGGEHLKGTERPREESVIRVRSLSPDEALDLPGIPAPDLLKLDLEGAEAQALRHMEELVSRKRPRIALELHNPECDAALWEFAERHKYRLSSLETGQPMESLADILSPVLAVPG